MVPRVIEDIIANVNQLDQAQDKDATRRLVWMLEFNRLVELARRKIVRISILGGKERDMANLAFKTEGALLDARGLNQSL